MILHRITAQNSYSGICKPKKYIGSIELRPSLYEVACIHVSFSLIVAASKLEPQMR